MESDLRIVRGMPDDEELAALVAVLFRRSAAPAAPATSAASSRWAASTRPRPRTGRVGRPGPGAWRASTLPR